MRLPFVQFSNGRAPTSSTSTARPTAGGRGTRHHSSTSDGPVQTPHDSPTPDDEHVRASLHPRAHLPPIISASAPRAPRTTPPNRHQQAPSEGQSNYAE